MTGPSSFQGAGLEGMFGDVGGDAAPATADAGSAMGSFNKWLPSMGQAIKGVASVQAGRAKADGARYKGQVAMGNKVLMERAAAATKKAGVVNRVLAGQKQRLERGAHRAAGAGRGVALSSGAITKKLEDMAAAGVFVQEDITFQAAVKADEEGFQGRQFAAEAKYFDALAGAETTAGLLGGAMPLFGNAAASFTKLFK